MKIRDRFANLIAEKPQMLVIFPVLFVIAAVIIVIVIIAANRRVHPFQPVPASKTPSVKATGLPPTAKPAISPVDMFKYSTPASVKAPNS